MDSVTPKTPVKMYHTPCLTKKMKIAKCRMSFGSHHGIWSIKKVAQGCQSGNQARIILERPLNKNHQKKFIGKNISRFQNFQIDYLFKLISKLCIILRRSFSFLFDLLSESVFAVSLTDVTMHSRDTNSTNTCSHI